MPLRRRTGRAAGRKKTSLLGCTALLVFWFVFAKYTVEENAESKCDDGMPADSADYDDEGKGDGGNRT